MATPTLSVRLESTDFECKDLRVSEFKGREQISRLFDFEIEVVCTDGDGIEGLAGSRASVVFEIDGLETRRIHGMIASAIDKLDRHAGFRTYVLRFVPRAFRLTLVEMQEIFLGVTVPEIARRKLDLVEIKDEAFDLRLVGAYAPREFVVQYRESDLAFVSRLTEHLGISFFFEHKADGDTIVFTDHVSGFQQGDPIRYRGRGETTDVYAFETESRLIPTYYAMQDYNDRTPGVDLTSTFELASGDAGGVVEYGSHHKTRAEGDALARVRAEERQSKQRVHRGKSDIVGLSAGLVTSFEGHPLREAESLLIVCVEHHFTQPAGLHSNRKVSYHNEFQAVSTTHTFRPDRVTPKPRIHGLVTGVIEERLESGVDHATKIDAEGRYYVKFIFDTSTTSGQAKPSTLVRMLQAHAGPNYGMHLPLKAGVEVLVAFVDGDPDRPLIVGAVPNPMAPSPVVAASATKNRIKTVSGIIIEMDDAGASGG